MAEEIKYNPETVKTVFSVLQKEFESEEGRNRHILSKVQMMLTVAGILLTAIIFLLKIVIEQRWYANVILLLVSLFLLIIAIILLLDVVRIKAFKRIQYEALVFNTELTKSTVEVESRLIATYEEALKKNIPITDEMAEGVKRGTLSIMISIGLIYIVLLTIFYKVQIHKLFMGGSL
ncbi:MAG: hypothetical protein HZB54_02145 [Deltaproteobacteria bacterium]|nr:hypothetical protein [Deltaproteobacteria bacterium]